MRGAAARPIPVQFKIGKRSVGFIYPSGPPGRKTGRAMATKAVGLVQLYENRNQVFMLSFTVIYLRKTWFLNLCKISVEVN